MLEHAEGHRAYEDRAAGWSCARSRSGQRPHEDRRARAPGRAARPPPRPQDTADASTEAMVHTTSCTRFTGMPRSTARSALSAPAARRCHVGEAKERREAPTDRTTATRAMTSLPPKTMGSISNETSNGAGQGSGESRTSNVPGKASLGRPGRAREKPRQELGQPERRHGEDEPGAVAKRRMMANSHERAQQEGHDQAGAERHQPGDADAHDEQHRGRGGHRPEVGLREVDDAVGPVDERMPIEIRAVRPADDGALHEHTGRRRPQDPLHDDQAGDGVSVAADEDDAGPGQLRPGAAGSSVCSRRTSSPVDPDANLTSGQA